MILVSDLLWLCGIASPTGSEHALCAALEQRFRGDVELGWCTRRHGESLVVSRKWVPGRPHIALMGHLDVVPTTHDGAPRVDGDRLYGPGASDMKSGLALILDVIREPPKQPLNITAVFYAGEEGRYENNQLGQVLQDSPELAPGSVDLALLLEPCDNALELGCGGSIHGAVQFHGKSAHSARPWQGENAIHKAAGLLARLAGLRPQPQTVEGLTWHESISATLARGGVAANVVPELFELNLNHRFGPATSIETAESALRQCVGSEADLRIVDRSPSAPPQRQHPLIQLLEHCGVREVRPKLGWTDVARCHGRGIPAVNFGPGCVAQAHQRNEWTSISALEEGRAILRRFLDRAGE